MSDGKNHHGAAVLIAAIVLLVIYVFFPAVILVPLVVALEHHWISEAVLQNVSIAFTPLEYLSNHIPLYQRMIQAEFDFCTRMGWVHLSM